MTPPEARLPWPPDRVETPDGGVKEVIDWEAGGSYVILEGDERIDALTLTDVQTDWESLYDWQGGGDTSEKHMRRFLIEREIEGVEVDITRNFKAHDVPEWDLPYEAFGFPDGNPKYAVYRVGINPRDWLRVCMEMHNEVQAETVEEWRESAYDPTVESVVEDIKNGNDGDIPTPVLEINTDYEGNHAEGRSRGFGALEAGLEWMPLWIAARDYY